MEHRLHGRRRRCGGDRHRRFPGRGPRNARQGSQRAGPLDRVAGTEPQVPRHVRPRDVHGRTHRRARSGAHRSLRGRSALGLSGHRPRCPDRQRQGRHGRRRHRCLPGDRRHRLGRPARPRPRSEHPGPEPLLRDQRHAAVHDGSTRLRGRAGVEAWHRRRRVGRQQRLSAPHEQRAGAVQPRVRSTPARRRCVRCAGNGHARRRSRAVVLTVAQARSDEGGRPRRTRYPSAGAARAELVHRREPSRRASRRPVLPRERDVASGGDRVRGGGARAPEVPVRDPGSGQASPHHHRVSDQWEVSGHRRR